MRVLVTGAAGFIGAYVAKALSARGDAVTGLDNFNPYYDPALKRDRVAALIPEVEVAPVDIADGAALNALFARVRPERVVHLAAQAGVRYSLENPQAYVASNVAGFVNVAEASRAAGVSHLVYASSSSVYGGGAMPPFSEGQRIDRPLSIYAATKVADEALAHAYAHLYGMALTGLRFFTVYGPWGRPDMAALIFPRAILAGRRIELFNEGRMRRDFTYVDDIAAGVVAALDRPPAGDPPLAVYNLGNNRPEALGDFVATIERAAGRRAEIEYKPLQAGDMIETMADITAAERELGFRPLTPIAVGMPKVVAWCRDYYGDAP